MAFMCEDQGRDYLYKNMQADRNEICQADIIFYFIPRSEFNAYLKQIKVLLSAVKKYRIFSLVMNTIYIFSL